MSQKIVFMGTPSFSVPILESLCNSNHTILHVYSQPPKKANRGQKIKISPVETFARKFSLSIRTPKNLNTEEFNFLNQLKPDIVIVVAYGKIIPKKYLSLSKKGFINIHASILPNWRGAAPIQRSIMNLDDETGISIMKISEELDTGPVSNIYKIKLNKKDNTQEISEKLSLLASKKILDAVDDVLDDKAKFIDQDHSKATYAKKIDKSEAKIDWSQEAIKIIGKINGLFPIPGAFFNFNGERYKILKAEIGNGLGKVGEILSDKLEIACINNQSIKVIEIQRQGKKPQKIGEFMLGSQIKKGSIISNA